VTSVGGLPAQRCLRVRSHHWHPQRGAMTDWLGHLNAVQETVEPPRLIGCVAQAIVAGRREIEDEAAVAVWLASGLAAETF
jgi:small ligand-binding sensory domain FIST